MMPADLKKDIEEKLSLTLHSKVIIKRATPLGGGCIHNALSLSTTEGKFFVKWNNPKQFDNFNAEYRGLKLLKSTDAIRTPKVFCVNKTETYAYLIQELIETGHKSKDFWQLFGSSLARLHKNTHSAFGLDYDNYIGSLEQINQYKTNWLEFFIEERLEVQLKLAENNHLIDSRIRKLFNKLYNRLTDILPAGEPALIHGDLWSGNYMVDSDGNPVVIDPAVYYANREIEIAFTKLFGGFEPRFYQAYNEIFPLYEGWQERVDIYNLYPLLVHLNLFGSSYLSQISAILRRFR